MGIKDSLVSMMGEFVELRRNPEFRSRTDLAVDHRRQKSDEDEPSRPSFASNNRRHSLQITCGTQPVLPEMMIQQRTFSARNSKVGAKDHTDSVSVSMRPSEQQAALQQRRYKHRRASEPLNLLAGIGSLGAWTRGSGQRKKKSAKTAANNDQHQPQQLQQLFAEDGGSNRSSPPGSPPSGTQSPAASLSKGSAFSRFYNQHPPPIEETEELEADMVGQRRQSHSSKRMSATDQKQRYATVIRL